MTDDKAATSVVVETERDKLGRFQTSGNPNGRPKSGGKGKPISVIRRSLTKMRRLEDRSLEILELSMLSEQEREEVTLGLRVSSISGEKFFTDSIDKAQLDSAKFVVKSLESMTKSATSDEIAEMNLRKLVFEDSDEIEAEVVETLPSFSMTLSPKAEAKYNKLLEEYRPDE